MTARKTIPTPDGDAVMFEAILADFRTRFPDAWDRCQTWPTASGLIFIAEQLKG